MKISNVKIPVPFQFTMDDVGWMEGRTPYWENFQPTRTGLPRRHTIDDYKIIDAIGKAANMKICGMFVLGDWDKKGTLSKIPYSNKLGKEWTGSPYVVTEEMEEIRDFLNSCTHLEMAVHGLLHECWDDNGGYMSAEFLPPYDFKAGDKSKRAPAPEWYMRAHLDGFFEIFNDWGFTQTPRAFTCPGHCMDAWKNGEYTKVIKDYGIRFWQEPYITHPFFDAGVLLNNMIGFLAFWEAYDLNPDRIEAYPEDKAGIICSHWPNFLRYDPTMNFENLSKWEAFFKRQAEVFGVIISRDIEFAHCQLLYRHHCILSQDNDIIKIDFSKVDKLTPDRFDAPIYISVKNDEAPFECQGAIITEYDIQKDFKTYQIKRTSKGDVYLKPKTDTM